MLMTVPQMQAIDVLLKSINMDPEPQKNIKPVINYSNFFITGDFTLHDGYYFKESKIHSGQLTERLYSVENDDVIQGMTLILKNSFEKYKDFSTLAIHDELAYLHFELIDLVTRSTTGKETSKLRPYLYNVRGIGNDIQLPFLELPSEKLDFVSLITVN